MRPLSLQGHKREISRIRYNLDGDLLFSAGADRVCLWYTSNGEKLGSYTIGGAIFDLDVDVDTKCIALACYESVRLFDTQTGAALQQISTGTSVNKACGFSLSGKLVMACRKRHPAKNEGSRLFVFDIRESQQARIRDPPSQVFMGELVDPSSNDEITSATWAGLDSQIIVGLSSGELQLWDIRGRSREPVVRRPKAHEKSVMDIQLSRDQTMVITASTDGTARLWDAFHLDQFKMYKANRPLNSAAISPIKPHILTGGGQAAMQVALTGGGGNFEALFYHLVYEEPFAQVMDHFGPINSLAYAPDGTGYASGAHDGQIMLHRFDSAYYDFEFEN